MVRLVLVGYNQSIAAVDSALFSVRDTVRVVDRQSILIMMRKLNGLVT